MVTDKAVETRRAGEGKGKENLKARRKLRLVKGTKLLEIRKLSCYSVVRIHSS